MASIVLLLGRPGSGKSQVARCIKGEESPAVSDREEACFSENREVVHITDYKHLLGMFQEEKKQRLEPGQQCFERSQYGGFTVTEFGFSRAVLDKALKQVNKEILQEMKDQQKQKLILVEFARSDYSNIKNVFDTQVLKSATVLYLQADLEVCVNRVHQRARDPRWEDDTFVSDDIMRGYYREEGFADLQEIFGMDGVKVVDNSDEWEDTWTEVKDFIASLSLRHEEKPCEFAATSVA